MKKHSASKWIVAFVACVLTVLMLLSLLAYIVDPFMQFRVTDNTYMLEGWYVGSGLVKNYDYDTLVLGSSMTQNFDMDQIREELDCEPLHIGLGGVKPAELTELLQLSYKTGKADTYYIGVDVMTFGAEPEKSRIPQHLLKDDALSTFRYLLSYEVWSMYLPMDVALAALKMAGKTVASDSTSIDMLGNWSGNFSEWGEEIVIENYKENLYSLSKVETENLYNRGVADVDAFLASCDFSKGEHIFFFSPYSSLCWCDYQERGQFEIYLQIKRYFTEQALKLGATVYDFQAAELTMDLDNYKDTTHYMPHINEWMVECFKTGECSIKEDDILVYEQKLIENTNAFREKYADLFQ